MHTHACLVESNQLYTTKMVQNNIIGVTKVSFIWKKTNAENENEDCSMHTKLGRNVNMR